MSDLEEELLGLAEDDPHKRKRSSKPKSSAYVPDDSEGEEEMDMDLDDSDSDADVPSVPAPSAAKRNPYPLEGSYIDEDDRDRLEGLPEIEREEILAARAEEMQKYKDSMALNAMYKMTGAGGADAGEDTDGEGTSRKRRKHTSVTKQTTRVLKDLRAKRMESGQRSQKRAERALRSGRAGPADSAGNSTEDGEVAPYDPYSRPSRSPPPKKRYHDDKEDKEDLDSMKPSYQDVNGARLSRYEIVDIMYKDGFEDVLKGSFVRLIAGMDPTGRPKYRVHRVLGLREPEHGSYVIEYKGRDIRDSRALLCAYGRAQREWRIADVSNSNFEEGEFIRFEQTCKVDQVKLPKRSELSKKHEEIKALRDRPMSDSEISRQVEARKQSNPQAQRNKAIYQIGRLVASRSLALRSADYKLAQNLEEEIIRLGGDPATGELVEPSAKDSAAGSKEAKEDYDERIRRINEKNRQRTKEAMAAAHQASIQRKKAEEAIIKQRQRVGTRSVSRTVLTGREANNSPAPAVEKPAIPPVSGLRKGETPQQYVARTVELDLGDF